MMKKTLTLLLGAAAIVAYAGLPNSMSKMSFDSQSDAVQTTYGVKSESANAGADIKRAADKVEMPTPILQMDFDDPSDLLKATIGNNAEFNNAGGDLVRVDAPNGKNAVTVKIRSYFTVDLSNSPKFTDGKTTLDQWTMVCDVRMPQMGTWYAFFNTYPGNPEAATDAEVFIGKNTNQLGGYYAGFGIGSWSNHIFEANKWYRIVLTFDATKNFCGYYADGQLLMKGTNTQVNPGSRYCPAKKLVLFGDDDGDDGTWDVTGIKIYDQKLTAAQVRELGGYDNEITPPTITPVDATPVLYDPSATTARVNWHGAKVAGEVKYGTDKSNLNKSVASTFVAIDDDEDYIWHTAKLEGLTPNTLYYYTNDGGEHVYSLKTLPANDKVKKIRFLTMGDSHNSDGGVRCGQIFAAAKKFIDENYGNDPHALDMILHTGDVTQWGDNAGEYSSLLFNPLKEFTPYVPMLATIGNHDIESPMFYKYFRNDDISGAPADSPDFGRYWSKRIGSMLLVGMDSWSYWPYDPVLARDRTPGLGEREKAWLDKTLAAAEANPEINMVFAMCHECPISELWYSGWKYTFTNEHLYPILKKYSKVQQITYGHAHGTEFGVSEPYSDESTHDIFLFNNANAGGYLDDWGVPGDDQQYDEAEISRAMPEFGFNIGEIDIENGRYNFKVYAVGRKEMYVAPVLREEWYGDIKQAAPAAPKNLKLNVKGDVYTMTCDNYDAANPGALYSSQFQVVKKGADGKNTVLLNVIRDYRNIYQDVDKNAGINLCTLEQQVPGFTFDDNCFVRARFRDDNRKWSAWTAYPNTGTGIGSAVVEKKIGVFCDAAAKCMHVVLPEGKSEVTIADIAGRVVLSETVEGRKFSWNYSGNAKGAYVVTVANGGKTQAVKVMAN